MPDIPVPVEVEFADFIAKLITETSDALIAAQGEQERRNSEFVSTATWDAEEFADKYVTDEEVDNELVELFPSAGKDHRHAIFVGAPYLPVGSKGGESPNLNAALGVVLESADYQVGRTGQPAALTSAAVSRVRRAARLRLATMHLAILRKTVSQGLPRVFANEIRLNAKLGLELARAPSGRVTSLLAVLKGLGQRTGLLSSKPQQNFRVIVRMADERAPQTQKLQFNVFGEIEITFKAII